MKKMLLLLSMAINCAALYSQTLINYGNNTIGKDEFLRAYNKNKTPVTDKEKSLRDYIELYTNFKLKVKAAKDLHIDTLPQLQADIDNFRRQIDENYMSDEKELKFLTDQAYDRSQQDVHIIHFSRAIPAESSPEDTLKIYNAIRALYNELKSGKTDYNNLAQSAGAKYGDPGFITVFTLPYQYENIVYTLKPSEVSVPYRSRNAWHIFKLLEQRKSAGKWKVAQILFSYPPDSDTAAKQQVQKLADSVYALLKKGADFSALAKTFSNDKLTYLNGGELPEFGSAKFDPSFETKVFDLKNDGDITMPFSTAFGIHIVKRLGYTPTPADKSDETFRFELKQKLMQDARIGQAKEKFAKDIMSKVGYQRTSTVKEEELFRYADSLVNHPDTGYINTIPVRNKNIITFTKGSLKVADWLKFVTDYKGNFEQYKGESNKELWNKYVTIAALEYYKKHLEEYNADFKFQMQEFKEGNMLFEVMERNVWTRAGADTAGLLQYYNAHKQNYKWAASADVLIVSCTSEKIAADAMAALKSGKSWKEIAENKGTEVQVDSARYELTQLNGNAGANPLEKDSYSPITKNVDGSATFIKYFKFYEPGQQRSFEESRGLVINDYQNVLEQKWLEDLHKKYPVKVNEALVKTMVR